MNKEIENQVEEKESFHMFEKKELVQPEESERVVWTKGDLVITCHNCGHVNVLQKGIENGIRLPDLYASNSQAIRLECTQCNSAMSMHFIKSEDGEVFVPPTTKEMQAEADITDAEIADEGKVIDIKTKEEVVSDKEPNGGIIGTLQEETDDMDKYDDEGKVESPIAVEAETVNEDRVKDEKDELKEKSTEA